MVWYIGRTKVAEKMASFTTFDIEDGLANKAINSIAEDEYGNLWLCTDGGISRFDGEQFINYFKEDGSFCRCFQKHWKDTVNNYIGLGLLLVLPR